MGINPLSAWTGPRAAVTARVLLSECGQIVIPAVFIFPTMCLFVYLLFETTKLSREKIRHQFAVDSAAFIEMTNYSDYLNRTAYVNGSFPHRIFKEAFSCPPDDNYIERTDGGQRECLYDVVYEMGGFPKNLDSNDTMMDQSDKWRIEFSQGRGVDLNVPDPQFPPQFDLFQHDRMIKLILSWDAAVGIYKLYARVYMLLGSVQDSQKSVYERLTDDHKFFRKSYYLNTGDCQGNPETCGDQGVSVGYNSFKSNVLQTKMHYVNRIYFAARKFVGGLDPLKVVETQPPIDMTQSNSLGLFQLATVSNRSVLTNIGRGLEVYQGWDPPSNYFKVDLKPFNCRETGKPCVHARIAAQCPRLTQDNNCVWPDPTPKYQTRLYP
ncbi:MAG: hypothetical protein PHP45_03755 [Elusimicrobiales bacterium]|nr:hypothetical protein [Elusimicrobiales bacterium]